MPRNIFLSSAAALLLLAAAGVQADDQPQPRIISVNGSGEVMAEPDKAVFNLGVEARGKNLADARDEVSRAVNRVLSLTDELGIPRKQVNTARAVIRPEYDWNKGSRNFRGYFVQRSVIIDLRQLDLVGVLMERAVDAGINQVNPPSMGSSREADLQRKALELAAADARKNAQAIAKGAGIRVGKVLSLSGNGHSNQPRPVYHARMAMAESSMDKGGEQSYALGQLTFSANVQAQYEVAD